MNPIVDPWLRFIHKTGTELAVTLFVAGRRITGFLTPIQRYEVWEKEVLRRAALAGGEFKLPSLELPPITREDAQKVQEAWPDLEKEVYDESVGADGFACLCLRNATVHEGAPAASVSYPALIIAVEAVAAFMPGFHKSP